MFALPAKYFPQPTYRDSVDQSLAAEHLLATARRTTDSETLLGLAYLVRTGDPIRRDLVEILLTTNPDYRPILAVLTVMLEGIHEQSINDLIAGDPDNALGYYLQGALRHQSPHADDEALTAFRKAAHCSELRLYESTTGPALFKALDALNLTGLDRLCALSWMASRSSQFSSAALQMLHPTLSELARSADIAIRREIYDLLLILAGHLFATNFQNRWFAQRAVEAAFGIKAQIAAEENSATENGYHAALHAMFSSFMRTPGLESGPRFLELAQFLPSRMQALWRAGENDPARRNTGRMMEIGWQIISYPEAHDGKFPENLDLLFETGRLKPPPEAKSILTGRPYVYVAAGEKRPMKISDASKFVLLYDDDASQGWHSCVTATCMASSIPADELKVQLLKRGKSFPGAGRSM